MGASCNEKHSSAGHSHKHGHSHACPGTSWKRQVAWAFVCLGTLIAAMIVGRFSKPAAWVFYSISLIAGIRYPLVVALHHLRELELDVDFLMLLVAGGAVLLGHPDEGAFLLFLFTASRAMESFAEERTRSAIEALTEEFPDTACRLVNGREESVPVDQIAAGDRLLVRPGEMFPVDARVSEGTSTADTSALTGEETPLAIKAGDDVPSGAVNGGGLVTVEAQRPAAESAYQKILRLVQQAPERRSPAQELSDKAGRIFTWAILGAAAAGFGWWRFGAGFDTTTALYRAMALLVAGSPCALVLSIPSAVLAGVATGARRGILFHGGRGLMGAHTVKTIAFDKTGTLTTGQPSVVEAQGSGANDARWRGVALRLAQSSTHPASKAVRAWLIEQSIVSMEIELEDIREVAGDGVRARAAECDVQLGRPNRSIADVDDGAPSVTLSVNGEPTIRFVMRETIRPRASCASAWLRARGLRLMVLSGDRSKAAENLAREIGIDEAHGNLRPEDKYRLIDEAGRAGPVMMVGDGVNDAPALARADVGVAMGMRGSAAALAEADIVLANDRLPDLVGALDISHRTRRIVAQNMTIAIGAAGILVLFALAGSLPLSLGVLGHEGGTVLVVLNSLRLLRAGTREHAHALLPHVERGKLAAAE